jgi:hypothetical protein
MCAVLQDREWYARRKDKLHMKQRFYAGAAVSVTREQFHAGSAYGIRELEQHFALNEAGESAVVRRVGHYYAAARLEGLAYREEQVGAKTVERYEARPDRLVQRSVTYGRVPAADLGVCARSLAFPTAALGLRLHLRLCRSVASMV